MYQIMLVVDEMLVRESMAQNTNWEKFGFAPPHVFENGRQALEQLESVLPDVVITDICMPVLDGIGLIREMREQKLTGHILVLSGHDDFAYVHEAMKLGIDDYLLKDDLTPENILHFLQEPLLAKLK